MNQQSKNQSIIDEITSWIGTPWRHLQCVKGQGVDCVQLIIGVAKNLGWLLPDYNSGKYPRDYSLHNSESLLIEEIKKLCVEIKKEDIGIGDILVFVNGKSAGHIGFYVGDGLIVHAHIRQGVVKDAISLFEKGFHSAWRLNV